MSINSLTSWITSSNKFQREYTCLLKKSVCSQISNLIRDNSENDENIVDWAYLISCASILAHSTDGTVLDIAYRICQATVCEAGLQREYKSAAAAIFDLSANSSAIALSESRHLIDSNFRSRIPWGTVLDAKQKQFSNSVIDGDKVAILNEFQKEVYDSFEFNHAVTVSAPTSAGKSFVILQIISEFIKEHPLAKIVYIVPTRALIQQVEMDIRGHLKQSIAGVEITSVPVLPDNYGTKSCVFIFTQERLQWVLNEHPEMFVDLVVVDEAHKIGDRARGILLEQVLQRISHDSTTRFIFQVQCRRILTLYIECFQQRESAKKLSLK